MKTIVNSRIDEKILFEELDTGLKIYFMPKPGFTKKYAVFSTDYGSIDNNFVPIGEKDNLIVPEGIAHFLEHKLFEEEDEGLFEKFSKYGASVNAFTNFNQTSYLFSATDNFYESLELLVKFVQNPYLTDENVEKEKGIIAQEIKMYDDNPGWRVFFNCLKAMYINHPVKIDIAGTVESINTITKELLYKAYDTFYNPSNMVLFVIGDLSFDKIIEVVRNSEKKFEKKEDKINRIYVDEPKKINEKFIEEKMVTATPLFYIGFKDFDLDLTGKDAIKKDLITNIILDLLFTPSSAFYNELYNEGLITSSFGAYFTGKKTYGHSLIVGESHKPQIVYEKVLELINKKGEEVLKLEDFNRIQRKNLGNFLMSLNSIEYIANNFVDLYFDNFMILDYLDVMEEIGYQDILKRFKDHFTKDNIVLSIINPAKKI